MAGSQRRRIGPADPDQPPASLSVEVTEYGTIELELAATTEQVGTWTIEATGPGGCNDVESLRIASPRRSPAPRSQTM